MNDKTVEIVNKWWCSLQDDNGGRAQLKRCQTPEEAALHPQTFRLKQVIPWLPLEAIATITGVASHIKDPKGEVFGKSLAKPKEKSGHVPFSESRFRQLLSARDWNELYRSLRRAITILDGKVNLISFVDTIILWSNELNGKFIKPGKGLKYKLSEDYYTEAIKHN